MAVTTTSARQQYSGNSSTTEFAIPFQFNTGADLKVIETVVATGVETVKTLTTHYTVAGGLGETGTLTMLVAPATGVKLTIINDPLLFQTLQLTEEDPLPTDSLEFAMDKLTFMAQRVKDLVSRSMSLSDGTLSTFDPNLPNLVAGKAIIVNADGDGFEMGPDAADLAAAADNAAAAAAAAAAAEAAQLAAEAAEDIVTAATYSNVFRDTVVITGDYTILPADNGTLFLVDTTADDVEVFLPGIIALGAYPFNVAVKKIAGSNNITVETDGTDTYDNGTNLKSILNLSQGIMFTAGESTVIWGTMDFAAVDGFYVSPAFVDGMTLVNDDFDMLSGDLNMTDGNITMTAGDLTMTAGDLDMTLGDLTLTDGDLVLSSGSLTVAGGANFTGGAVDLEWDDYVINPREYDAGNSGTSKTIDWNNAATQKLTLTGNCVLTFDNPCAAGSIYILRSIQGSGPYTLTFPGTVKWAGNASAPTLTATSGRKDVFSFYWNGTNYEASYLLGYNS